MQSLAAVSRDVDVRDSDFHVTVREESTFCATMSQSSSKSSLPEMCQPSSVARWSDSTHCFLNEAELKLSPNL